MMFADEKNGLALRTLRLYGELVARRESWGGKIVLGVGAGISMSGLGAAASCAGGTSLMVDTDKVAAKKSMRKGGVDFVVATLDEALRVLKNEVRKGKPLGVVMLGEIAPALEEMVERGVVPDAMVEFGEADVAWVDSPDEELLASVEELGMRRLRLEACGEVPVLSETVEEFLSARGWREFELKADSPLDLRLHEAEVVKLLAVEDVVRRNWVSRISQFQQLDSGASRFVWLTLAEHDVAARAVTRARAKDPG